MIMWAKGDMVRKEHIPDARGYMGEFDEETAQRIFEHGIGTLSPIGVLGDPSGASGEHGRAYIDDLTSAIVEHINSQ